jgi:hypothetical protein
MISMEAVTNDYSGCLSDNNDKYVISCRTLHVGSIPYTSPSLLLGYSSSSNSSNDNHINCSDTDALNYSVEMTLREFQQFLEEGQCWYRNQSQNGTTRQSECVPLPIGRNRTGTMMFDPCNALGAEVSLGDFLMHNHNNIDIKVHEAIHTEEIQVSDNRRSAVLVIMERQHQQEHEVWDDEFNSSLEVQPIHTFDDLIPPNLMNASFDLHNDDDDDAVTVDMNESYSEDPLDDQYSIIQDLGGWVNYDDDDDDDENIESVVLSSSPISLFDIPFLKPMNSSVSLVIIQHSNECGSNIIEHENDDSTNIDCQQQCTMNGFVNENCQESCHLVSEIIVHGKEHSPIQSYSNYCCDSIIPTADTEGMILECSTNFRDSIERIDISTFECSFCTETFAAFMMLQFVVLAVSYYLRCPSDFSSISSA